MIEIKQKEETSGTSPGHSANNFYFFVFWRKHMVMVRRYLGMSIFTILQLQDLA